MSGRGSGGRFEWNYSESSLLGGTAIKYFGPGGTFGNTVWHHLAVTFNRGGSAVAYVDGVAISTNSIAPGGNTIDSGLPTNIGNDGTGAYPATDGYFTNVFNIPTNGLALDDLGIWRRALLPTEIRAIYNAGLVGQDLSTVTTAVRPQITAQPQSQTMVAGQDVSFTVGASGTAPFDYQWTFNNTNLIGATNATLSLSSVQTNDAGAYAVVVTNVAGSVTSSNATLTVNVPAGITTQPVSQSATQNSNVVFSVMANGTVPFNYQWTFNNTNLIGATNATLSLTSVQTNDAGAYAVVVTNIAGSVTSSNAMLTVNVPASITTQPVSQTVIAGQYVSFTVVPSGTAPFGYQWTFNNTNLDGATNAALSFTSVSTNNTGTYAVVVTNVAGSVTSSNSTLTVNVPVGITTQPVSQSATQNSERRLLRGGERHGAV